MASPVTIQASHPPSHFFREHSTYSEDYSSRRLRESVMGQHRAHPYERRSTHSPPKPVRDYRSTRFADSDLAGQQTTRSPPPPPRVMHPNHSAPSHLAASSGHPPSASAEGGRIAVGHLVDRTAFSPSQPAAAYHSDSNQHSHSHSQAQSAPMSSSPPRANEQDPAARLPGIGSLLSLTSESQRSEREQRYAAPPVSTAYQQPRYQHSAASSLSSAVSEPVSPSSFGGYHSRSPIAQPPPPSMDGRARAASHLPYYTREEQHTPISHYDHQRAQTLPSLPVHPSNPHQPIQNAHHSYPPPPPPPPSSQTILPPPPEPYQYGHYPAQRPVYPYPPPAHHSHAHTPGWDRPRMDSAIPGYEHSIASVPPYGWPYGHHGHANMARKRRGNLPKDATKILKDWFGRHHDSPYPSEDEKQDLCRKTGLQISQVNNWFINARRRLPREDARKQVEKEGQQQRSTTADSTDSAKENSTGRGSSETGIRYP